MFLTKFDIKSEGLVRPSAGAPRGRGGGGGAGELLLQVARGAVLPVHSSTRHGGARRTGVRQVRSAEGGVGVEGVVVVASQVLTLW